MESKPTEKRPLGRPSLRWEDNIRMDLKQIGINTRNLVESAQDRDYEIGPPISIILELDSRHFHNLNLNYIWNGVHSAS